MNNNINVWNNTTNSNNLYASTDLITQTGYCTAVYGNNTAVYGNNTNDVFITYDTSAGPYYYYNGLLSDGTISIIQETTQEKLDSIDIKDIEQYLRKKKIENIKKLNDK